MDIRHIRYFKTTAELEHMTRAAQALFVSQAQLSRVIAELEDELGVQLFDRVGKGIRLNDCGRAYYKSVIKMLGFLDDAKRQVQELYHKSQYKLSIVSNAGAYMPALLTEMAAAAPGVKVRQFSAPRKGVLSMLRRGDVDFAVCCPPIYELDFNTVELRNEIPIAIYPPGHWLEDYKEISMSRLMGERFIGVPQGFGARDAVDVFYRERGLAPDFVIETGDTSAVLQYVYAGLGVAVCPKSLVVQDSYFIEHRTELIEDMPAILGLSWKKDKTFSEHDEIFFEVCRKYFEALSRFDGM